MKDKLKTLIQNIKVQGGSIAENRDLELAKSLCDHYQLQLVLETTSDFIKEDKLQTGWEHYVQVTKILISLAPESWIESFARGFDNPITRPLCITSLKTLVRLADAPVFESREYYVYEEADFTGLSEKGMLVLSALDVIFEKCRNIDGICEGKCLIYISCVSMNIISRHMEINLWTNSEIHNFAKEFLRKQKEILACKHESDLFVVNLKSNNVEEGEIPSLKSSMFGMLLHQWTPFLQRSCWQKYPTVAASFTWCLNQLKFPHTSVFIELVIPPALLFTDDSLLENKLMGIRCLFSIMENCTAEELRWFGRADVIYEALKLQMYRTEEELLVNVQKALLLVLKIVVKRTDDIAASTKYDEIFLLLLQNASHENKLSLRRVHTQSIHNFIEQLGISAIKYIGHVLELVEEYLEISDPPNEEARINILKALLALLKTAWPRIQAHTSKIIRILVKLIHDTTSKDLLVTEEVKKIVLEMAVKALKLLKEIDPSVSKKINSLPFTAASAAVIDSVIS